MAGLFNKVKNAVIGEDNDHHDTLNTAAPRGEPTIGTTETTPARGLADGPQAASGFHSDPRAVDKSGAFNARGINNNPIGDLAHGGSRTTDTAGPHNSDVANKLDPRVDSDRDGRAGGLSSGGAGYGSQHQPGATSGYGNTSTNTGPHNSNVANKLDPRVDSDRDGRTGVEFGDNTRSSTAGGPLSSSTHHHDSTNAGPHNSSLANKLDPRVDSDRDGRGIHDNTHGSTTAGGFGSSASHSSTTGGALHSTRGTSAYDSAANNGPHDSRVANKLDPRVDSDRDGVPSQGIYNPGGTTVAAALGLESHHDNKHHNTSTNAGPHDSNITNKLDPRVDSDRDGRGTHGTSGVGGFGTHTSQNAGPHESNIANKLDPRVDSDRDGRGAHGTSGVGGFGGSHGTHQTISESCPTNNSIPVLNAGTHSSGTHNTSAGGFGTNTSNAGPHHSNVANKLDPTVDSDLDGHGRHGTHGTHNSSATALGAGAGGLGLGHSSHGTHGTHGAHGHNSNIANKIDPRVDSDRHGHGATHGTDYPQKYDPLVTSIPGTHNKPPGAPLTEPPRTTGTSGIGHHHDTHGTHDSTHGTNTVGGITHGAAGTHSGETHGSNLPGPAPNTAGPHKSDLMNKLDPKVDSNLDGKAGFMS